MKLFLGCSALLISLTTQASLTVGGYNIRNFDYDERSHVATNKPELASIIKGLNVDILTVEEIGNTSEFENFVAQKMPGYEVVLSKCGGAHNQHVGFVYNTAKVDILGFNEDLSITDPGKAPTCDGASRPLGIGLFQIKASKQKFYGMVAHLKSGSDSQSLSKRLKQYEVLKKIVLNMKAKTEVKDFFIAGDFNSTEYANRGSDYTALTKVVKDMGMIDLAQNVACSSYWWGGSDDGIESPSLLDHVMVTPGLLKTSNKAQVYGHCKKVSCKEASLAALGISYQGVSDHCPITATIQ